MEETDVNNMSTSSEWLYLLTSDEQRHLRTYNVDHGRFWLPPRCAVPKDSLVYFRYLNHGGANVVFKIQPWEASIRARPFVFIDIPQRTVSAHTHLAPGRLIHHREIINKVLRLSRGLEKTLPSEQIVVDFEKYIKPAFAAAEPNPKISGIISESSAESESSKLPVLESQNDFTRFLMTHELVGLFDEVVAELRTQANIFGDDTVESKWAILLPDLSPQPNKSVTLEVKPKWLLQSPNAPDSAIRCRTCALQTTRRTWNSEKYICPLKLLDGKSEDLHTWVRSMIVTQITAPTSSASTPADNHLLVAANSIVSYLRFGEGRALLIHLRDLQETLDPVGILARTPSDPIFDMKLRLAMTLRDCSLYIRASHETVSSKESGIVGMLGDLDFKSAAKMEDWSLKERTLRTDGAYVAQIDLPLDCFLTRRRSETLKQSQ